MVDVVCESPSSKAGFLDDPSEDAALTKSDPQAASSSCSSQSSTTALNAPYIVVQFDDGPESGLLAEVCEEDYCHPKFWRFQEVHCKPPKAKILFDDGVTLYTSDVPFGFEGRMVDEDGDEHSFLRSEKPQILGATPEMKQRPRRGGRNEAARSSGLLDDSSSVVARRTASGGYGHVTVEAVIQPEDENVDDSLMKSTKPKRLKTKRGKDEDWAPGKQKQPPAPSRHKRLRRVVADDSDDEAKTAKTTTVVVEPPIQQGLCTDDAACSGPVADDSAGVMERASCEEVPDSDARVSADSSGVELHCEVQAEIAGAGQSGLPVIKDPAMEPKCFLEVNQSDSDVEVCCSAELPVWEGAGGAPQVVLGASNDDDSDDFEMHVVK